MENEQTPVPSPVDGGTPTDQEALLASQVDTIGDNPLEEPVVTPPAGEDDAAAVAAAAEAASAAEAAAQAATDAAAVAVAAPAPAPAPVAATPVPAPTPPMDFKAALAAAQTQYDDGDLDGVQWQDKQREIILAEARYNARLEIWAERQETAADLAASAFTTVATGWEQTNKEFMGNPLRAQQMQAALAAVEAKTPGLSPSDMFQEAEKIAFEAFNWKPATTAVVDVDAARAAAIAGRQPAGVPQTLAGSPAAGPIEKAAGNSGYAALDALDISELENATARMTDAQKDAYLRDAPGATSIGTPGN